MRDLKRMIPFLWPHRRKFFLSCVFGVLVAILWGGNLTIVYPVMQVLLKERTLQEFVTDEIAQARQQQVASQAEIVRFDHKLADLRKAKESENTERFRQTLATLGKHQENLAQATDDEWYMLWAQSVVQMPWFPTSEYRTFLLIICVVVLMTAVKGVFTYLQDVLVGECVESSIVGIRKHLLRNMLRLDYQTLSSEGSAGLMSRFTYDTEILATGMGVVGGRFIREPLKCVSCGAIAFWINWRLTLLSLVMLPVIGLVFAYLSKTLKRASRRMAESMTRVYKILEETFDGMKVVIAFGTAHLHRRKFESEYQNYYKKAVKVVKLDAVTKPTMEMLGVLSLFCALLPGAYLVLRHKTEIWGISLAAAPMSVESLGVLYAMLAGMLDPCRKMNASLSRLRRALVALERILAMMDTKPLVQQVSEALPLPRHSQSIAFDNITFRYTPRGTAEARGPVLNQFSLKIQAGEVVAIVGQNGCGKSTLVQLLPRFFDPQAGDIYVDGHSIRDVRLADLRRQIGLVTQETILFDATLRENITYGTEAATQKQIEEAARKAHLGPILQQLPQGYDTPLGDKGKSLSGGQRQRVALARAILRDPSILILDEATSATDAESEALIHQTLKEFVRGRTVMLITHSMSQSLLDFVTRVVVMDHGRVIADGSHSQLLATCPLYQRLFQAPSRREAA